MQERLRILRFLVPALTLMAACWTSGTGQPSEAGGLIGPDGGADAGPTTSADAGPTTSADAGPTTTCTQATSSPCVGTVTGAINESFTCTLTFAQSMTVPGKTTFRVNSDTVPSDIGGITMNLEFDGSPQLGTPTLDTGDDASLFTNPLGLYYARATDMSMTITGAVPRQGGTPGDYCLHGTADVSASQNTTQGAKTVMVHVDF